MMLSKTPKALRVVLIVLAVLAAALTALLCAYRIWEKPPETGAAALTTRPSPTPSPAPTGEPLAETPAEEELPQGEPVATERQDGVYTILLVGNDDGHGNTDTILFGRIDTLQHRMDFVSIPRDTLINTAWEVRKINAVYWGSRYNGGDGISALKQQIARLTGFEPDCYAVVDLDVFVQAVDLIGGVWFDVPMAMDYEDLTQDLTIHLQPGYQLLDGYQAMGLCRFRSGYVTGDLGRIEMQQQFLGACASQFLSLGNIPRAPELIRLLSENLDTDLSAANMAFFLRQFLSCKAEDIHFHTAPNRPEMISGYSYAVLELDAWLRMVNDCLNPFDAPVGWQNVDIVYRSGSGFAGTAGLRGADYYRTQPAPAPAPAPVSSGGEPAGSGEMSAEIITEPASEPAPEPEPEPDDGGTPAIIVVEP